MGIPHKHAELIKAWADGAKIQVEFVEGSWTDVEPHWYPNQEYRIKPEPKPDYVIKSLVEYSGAGGLELWPRAAAPNIKLTFDGETKKLKKVEMIDE